MPRFLWSESFDLSICNANGASRHRSLLCTLSSPCPRCHAEGYCHCNKRAHCKPELTPLCLQIFLARYGGIAGAHAMVQHHPRSECCPFFPTEVVDSEGTFADRFYYPASAKLNHSDGIDLCVRSSWRSSRIGSKSSGVLRRKRITAFRSLRKVRFAKA